MEKLETGKISNIFQKNWDVLLGLPTNVMGCWATIFFLLGFGYFWWGRGLDLIPNLFMILFYIWTLTYIWEGGRMGVSSSGFLKNFWLFEFGYFFLWGGRNGRCTHQISLGVFFLPKIQGTYERNFLLTPNFRFALPQENTNSNHSHLYLSNTHVTHL